MANPAVKKNQVTILKGTPNEKKFYFENPTNPTPNDIAKVKEYYGIAETATPQQVIAELNKFKQATQADILKDIPFDPEKQSKEYYAELAQKMSDVNQRMKLIEDPANYYFKDLQSKLPYGLDRLVPDQLVSKGSFETIGALSAMGAAGLATAPTGGAGAAAAKILGADVLGATAGGQVYELTNQILRHLNDLPTEDQALQNAKFLKDAYMNLAFSGGAMALGPVVKAFKPAVGRVLFGLDNKNPEYQKMLEVAETYGMPLGIIQATNSSFWKGYSKVLGVFPYVGTPFRRAGEGTNEAIRQYFDTATKNFAPFQTMASLGGDISKLARKEYEDTMTISRLLYEDFENYAKRLEGKKVIKIDTVKRLSKDFVDILKGQMPKTGYYEFKFPGSNSEKAFREFYETMAALDPDGITIQQGRKLQELFSNFAANFKVEGKGIVPTKEGARITQLGLALEHDMNKLVNIDDDVEKVVFDTALEKLTTANSYLADIMPKYEGPVQSIYKQVNRNIFGPGPQSYMGGSMYPKQALETILGIAKNDPEAMKVVMRLAQTPKANLDAYYKAGMKEGVPVKVKVQTLDDAPNLPNGDPNPNFGKTITTEETVMSMGPNAGVKQIVRKLYDNALEKSFSNLPTAKTYQDYKNLAKLSPEEIYKQGYKNTQDVYRFRTVEFDPMKFADELGLNTPDGRATLEVALKGTGTKIKDIERFLDVAERAGSFTVTDPSTFVQRRVTLGGFKSLLLFGGAQAGATMAGFGLPMLMVPIMLRYGSSILTDPQVLKSFSEILEDTGMDVAKRTAIAKGLAGPEDTKEALKPFTISKENQKILLDWANATLPTEDELDQLDFVNQVEQSILSLMKEPQKNIEARNAREDQMNIMKKLQPGTRSGLSAQEAEIGNQLINRLQPTFMAGGEEMLDTAPSVAGGQLSPNVRSNLAFGSLDEALESQYGGINNLMP
jgi:hypothetical protein